ncbi:MAG: metalloregulator ArsR/SmtB family transcription factor [Bacteroidia bacterium]
MEDQIGRFPISFLEGATGALRAVAHPIRLAIVDLLKDNQSLNVTEIHESLGIEQAVASHHLRIMKDKGLLSSQRDGKNTFYSLKNKSIGTFVHLMEELQH